MKGLYVIRIFIVSIFLVFAGNIVFGQDVKVKTNPPDLPLIIPNDALCGRPASTVCNLIENNSFNTSCFGVNPFAQNCVSKWSSMSGSPQINVFQPQLSSGTNHASAWARSQMLSNGTKIQLGEGIVTGIPKLTVGNNYTFSIYKRFISNPAIPTPDLDEFNIILMKCSDYLSFRTGTEIIPSLPADAFQSIYCEKDVQNSSFERVNRCFQATDEWDIVWIFPKESTYLPNETESFAWLEVANFELVNINNFTAGNSPSPSYPNCIVNVGPTIPNCGLDGAVYIWKKPNQTIYSQTGQTIQVDASNPTNVGTWTLIMTIPNASPTSNSTCGLVSEIKATVNIPLCQSCKPTITANGPLEQCVQYESPFLTFSTNITSNIQWFNNNNPINGATAQTYTENNNPGPAWPTSTGTYYVKNTLNGCTSDVLTVVRKNYSAPYVYPGSQTPLQYCKNSSGALNQSQSITDPNTIFSWRILDPAGNDVTGNTVILGANNSTTYQTTISFANYPYNSAKIIAIATDNGCTNSFTEYQVTINVACRGLKKELLNNNTGALHYSDKKEISTNDVYIYPNPAQDLVTFSANSNSWIQSIRIEDFYGTFIKEIKVNASKTVSVNINDLKKGIYNCKVSTTNGFINKRLIVNSSK